MRLLPDFDSLVVSYKDIFKELGTYKLKDFIEIMRQHLIKVTDEEYDLFCQNVRFDCNILTMPISDIGCIMYNFSISIKYDEFQINKVSYLIVSKGKFVVPIPIVEYDIWTALFILIRYSHSDIACIHKHKFAVDYGDAIRNPHCKSCRDEMRHIQKYDVLYFIKHTHRKSLFDKNIYRIIHKMIK